MIKTQVCILGAGAGGIGCAWRLIKNGISVVIIDKNPDFGGTMVFSGVDGWEPGVSLDGIHTLIKDELQKIPYACHVTELVPNINLLDPTVGRDWTRDSQKERPWGYCMGTNDEYESTMGRCLSIRGEKGAMKRFQFDGDFFAKALGEVFKPFKTNLTTLFGYRYISCKKEKGKILSITVKKEGESKLIFADYFVDASGDIVLARDAGCAYSFGEEGESDYGEPSANTSSNNVNGVTYVFRISKTNNPQHFDIVPDWVKKVNIKEWKQNKMRNCISFAVQYPNGDINFNMLPTMEGNEYLELGKNADEIGKARVYEYWNYLQNEKGLQGYALKKIFKAGVRESYRLKGKYVLKEQDLRARAPLDEKLSGKIIAVADHALDVHGKGGNCKELTYPYQIPLECAMTNEYDNLFVACRGASFTHIAASSARLSRTMLSFGEGVGEYLVEKIKEK